MSSLRQDMAAYEAMRDSLEHDHLGKWVLIYNERLVDTFETFHDAADVALQRFGRGPYHIRQIGEEAAQPYPASLRFRSA